MPLEDRHHIEIFHLEGKIFDEVLADEIQPLLLVGGEAPARRDPGKGPVHSFRGAVERGFPGDRPLHHRDDIRQILSIDQFVGLLKLLFREVMGLELAAQFFENFRAPPGRALDQDPERFDLGALFLHEPRKGLQVVLGLLIGAAGMNHHLGGHLISHFVAHEKAPSGSRIILEELLKILVSKELQSVDEVVPDPLRQFACELSHVAVGKIAGKLLARFTAHIPFDAAQAPDEDLHKIIPVNILVDVLDDRFEGDGVFRRKLDPEIRGVLEILDQSAVEAVEDGEMGLVDVQAAPGCSTQHLDPENSGLDRSQEDDKFERRNVHACAEHVHRHHHFRVGTVPEFADLLQRAVDAGAAGDLLDECVALPEFLAAEPHQLIAVGGVGQVVHGKDEDLGEAPRFLLVPIGMASDFLDDSAVAFRRRDLLFDLFGGELPLVLQLVVDLLAGFGIDHPDLLARFEENPLEADLGFDPDDLIVHQETVLNRLFRGVTVDHLVEEGQRMGGGGGGETDFDGVEVVENIAPYGGFPGRVAPVAFIGDDDVKGVDGNIQLTRIVLEVRIVLALRKGPLPAEQIDRHPLDGRNIDESMRRLR